jgi:hypothetical protein
MAGPIDLVLLRGLLPDLPLREGTTVAARVLQRDGARGLLAMEGARVWAALPDDVPEGARLRLRVADASAQRITLQIVDQQQAAAPASSAQTPPPVWTGSVALPGGAQAHLIVERDGEAGGRGGSGAPQSVVLRYDSPALGRLDMLVTGDGVSIHAPAGVPANRAREHAIALQGALRRVTGRAATVTVHDRTETLDFRA